MKNLVIFMSMLFSVSIFADTFDCGKGGKLEIQRVKPGKEVYYADLTFADGTVSTLAKLTFAGKRAMSGKMADDDGNQLGTVKILGQGLALELNWNNGKKSTCTGI